MSAVLWDLKVGDQAPTIRYQLRHKPDLGSRFGSPVDLSTASQVTISARREWSQVLVYDGNALVTNATAGEIAAVMTPLVAAEPGLVAVEAVATWPDLTQQTWPAESLTDFVYIRIRGDLGGVIPTSPTGTVLSALFVAAGGTGIVTYSGQHVFAGPGAQITVAPTVTSFTVAANPNEAAWTPLTVPTITQAGATFSPQSVQALRDSQGAEVVLAKDGTDTWYGTTPVTGGGPGTIALSYHHVQAVASTTWTVNHALGFIPSGIVVQDNAGNDVIGGDVTHVNVNQLQITFLAPVSGTADVS
jgi:hypothetical protein